MKPSPPAGMHSGGLARVPPGSGFVQGRLARPGQGDGSSQGGIAHPQARAARSPFKHFLNPGSGAFRLRGIDNRTPIETRVPLNISTALRGENPRMVEECSKKRQRPPWSGAFQFLDPLAWRLCGSSTNQHSFRQKVSQPYRPSSLAGSPNWPVCWNGRQSSQHLASTAQRFCPPLRTAIVPRLRVLPQLEHTNAPTFPCVTAFPARAPNARASPRGDSIPLERRLPPSLASHSGGKPPHPTRCRDRERRPRTVAAFGVRPSCWRCRGAGPRLGSYCPAPVFLARSTPAPVRLPTRQHFPSDSRVLSRPGVGTPEQAVSA
jgi:hypothetical protein